MPPRIAVKIVYALTGTSLNFLKISQHKRPYVPMMSSIMGLSPIGGRLCWWCSPTF